MPAYVRTWLPVRQALRVTEPAGSSTVLVLGAGFSRSISAGMPLIDEMGNEATSIVGVAPADGVTTPFERGDFEVSLSRQAQPQPYRSAAEDADAHARFLRLTEGVTQLIDQRVEAAFAGPAPDWLITLVRVLHARRATVLTFNYDRLSSAPSRLPGCTTGRPPPGTPRARPGGRSVTEASSLTERRACSPAPTSARWRRGPSHLPPPYKLHGSTTWYWVPGDPTGATLRGLRCPVPMGRPTR